MLVSAKFLPVIRQQKQSAVLTFVAGRTLLGRPHRAVIPDPVSWNVGNHSVLNHIIPRS